MGGVGGEVFLDADEAAEVAEGIFGEAHLLEVVLPGVGLGAAAEVRRALDGGRGAVRAAADKGLGGDLEGEVFAGVPEALGELVREEEGVVEAFAAEVVDGGVGGGPREAEPVDVPAAEVEAVLSRLLDDEAEKVDTGEGVHAHRAVGETAGGGVGVTLEVRISEEMGGRGRERLGGSVQVYSGRTGLLYFFRQRRWFW